MGLKVGKLLSAVTATGIGTTYGRSDPGWKTFQGTVVGTGAVAATVKVQVSNDEVVWLDLATITLSGTTSSSDGFSAVAPWAYYRGNCTAISGTGATLNVTVASSAP